MGTPSKPPSHAGRANTPTASPSCRCTSSGTKPVTKLPWRCSIARGGSSNSGSEASENSVFKMVCEPPSTLPSVSSSSPRWSSASTTRGSLKGISWEVHWSRSEEHTSELQSRGHLVCRLLLEKKKKSDEESNAC